MIDKLRYIPNLPHENINFGNDDNDNVEVRRSDDSNLVKHSTPH